MTTSKRTINKARKTGHKLTDRQTAIMATVLGVSNLGMDNLFLEFSVTPARFAPEKMCSMAKYCENFQRDVMSLATSLTNLISQNWLETDEQAEAVHGEVKDFIGILNEETTESTKLIWPDFTAFLEAAAS